MCLGLQPRRAANWRTSIIAGCAWSVEADAGRAANMSWTPWVRRVGERSALPSLPDMRSPHDYENCAELPDNSGRFSGRLFRRFRPAGLTTSQRKFVEFGM